MTPLSPGTPPTPSPSRSVWRARGRFAGEDHRVIALLGDGALTGGLAYEGLNNAGASRGAADRHSQRQRHVHHAERRRDLPLSCKNAAPALIPRFQALVPQIYVPYPRRQAAVFLYAQAEKPHPQASDRKNALRGHGLYLISARWTGTMWRPSRSCCVPPPRSTSRCFCI